MKRIVLVMLLGLCFAVPVMALAQDTPTAEEPTLAPTEFVTETPTAEPTATDVPTETPSPTPTPVPEPEPPAPPPPTDWNLIIPWIGAAILVICIGGFTVLRTALVQLGRS